MHSWARKTTPHQAQSQPHNRRWEFLPIFQQEQIFSNVFLLTGLAHDFEYYLLPHQLSPLSPCLSPDRSVIASPRQLHHTGGNNGTSCTPSWVADWPQGATFLLVCQLGYQAAPGGWHTARSLHKACLPRKYHLGKVRPWWAR